MATTVRTAMVNLEANQFNPETIYNSNLEILDVLLQCTCISTTNTSPPAAVNGDVYIPAIGSTGDWTGYSNYIAYYYNGWKFISPKIGWRILDTALSVYKIWDGTIWGTIEISGTFNPSSFEVTGPSDITAKVKFNTDNIPTATTIYLEVPDSDFVLAKQNLSATTVPTTANDSTQGYSIGSVWVNTTTDKGYFCVDATASNAIWKEMAGATGTGDVLGPATSVINEIAVFNDTTGDTIKGSSVLVSANKELYNYHRFVDTKATNYTLVGSDSGKVIVVNSSSAITITLPQTTTETIANGFTCSIIRLGSGTVTIAIQGSDVLHSKLSAVNITPQYGRVEVTKIVAGSPNTWHLSGDLG